MNLSIFFTLARRICAYGCVAWLFWCMPQAQAQTVGKFNADACQAVYQLAPSEVQLHDNASSQWWFVPYPSSLNQSERAVPNSFELRFANAEKFLDASNDTVLIRWHSKFGDALRWASTQPYLIVRNGSLVRDMNGNIIGSFSHLIAKARWDTRVLVEQTDTDGSEQLLIAPLRVEHAVSEVDKDDRVIPRICLNAITPTNQTFNNTVSATQSQILGLADTHSMGAQSHLAMMDKGGMEGVAKNQTWFLVDALSKEKIGNPLSVIRARGQVEIVQVFEHYSLIRIEHSEREVMRGTYLKRATTTSSRP
ncbi:MAG: hypothetical protein H6R05_193 [Burkholderiaceae bacterium]|nr:hypothetical protein [Burkholderiaceae bacterium]